MHLVGKRFVTRPSFAMAPPGILAESRTQEVLLAGQHFELAKLKVGDAGLEFSAWSGVNEMRPSRNDRTKRFEW